MLKKVLNKIYIPSLRYNSFFGNQGAKEIFYALITIFLPHFFFKKHVQKYEEKFGQVSATKFNFSYALGRMALYHGLKALNLSQDDEILVPAFTCVVVPNAIIYAGLKPCYVDIEDTYYNFDLEDLRKKITSKTKVIYLQYTFGHHSSSKAIIELAREHNLLIVEDCAHLMNQKVETPEGYAIAGSIGIFSFFSTDHSKVITTGVGGVLCTNDTDLSKKIKSLNAPIPFISSALEIRILLNFLIESLLLNPWCYWFGEFFIAILMKLKIIYHFNNESVVDFRLLKNYPLKLSGKLALLGIIQLNQLDKSNKYRRDLVEELNNLIPLKDQTKNLTLLRYSFLISNRKNFEDSIRKKIILGVWFNTPFQGRDGNFNEIFYEIESCPKAEYIAEHIVNFPLHLSIPKSLFKNILTKDTNVI